MRRSIPKYAFIVLLIAVIVVSWWYAVSIYRENKSDIILAVEDIAQEIALPYHIARLSLQDPDERLPVPVYGIPLDAVGNTWGAARKEGRTHEGTDIFAGRGTPVFSATKGIVIRLNIGTRGGRNVMVVGPAGLYYYYAHLERIAGGINRGVRVTEDTVLGFVGNSGNATGTPPHLHFGIYPRQWEAINPYPQLIDRWEG